MGSQPASVYWRRRLVLAASALALVLLVALTAKVLLSDGGSSPAAAGTGVGTGASTAAGAQSTPAGTTPAATHSSLGTSRTSGPSSPSGRSQPATRSTASAPSGSSSRSAPSGSAKTGASSGSVTTSSVPPKPCTSADLALAAESGQSQYAVGDSPVLSILITNTSATACVQDLADPKIVISVYNGESRVWGSHDCKIEPGTDVRTIMAGTSVRISIDWTGLASRPNDCADRQRVGAGTYTVYASLAGQQAKAGQFTMS